MRGEFFGRGDKSVRVAQKHGRLEYIEALGMVDLIVGVKNDRRLSEAGRT